jgi:hypothetical protein
MQMKRFEWRSRVFLGLLAPGLLCVTGCAGGSGETQLPPVPAPSAVTTASPTPTLTASAPRDPSGVAAQAAVKRFWRVLDRLSADPRSSLTDIFTVSRGQVADQYIRNITQYRVDRVHQVGSVSVEPLSSIRQSKRDRYKVAVCLDVSGADIVDKNGKSTISSKRAPRVRYGYEVLRDAGKWYVITEQAGKTC